MEIYHLPGLVDDRDAHLMTWPHHVQYHKQTGDRGDETAATVYPGLSTAAHLREDSSATQKHQPRGWLELDLICYGLNGRYEYVRVSVINIRLTNSGPSQITPSDIHGRN